MNTCNPTLARRLDLERVAAGRAGDHGRVQQVVREDHRAARGERHVENKVLISPDPKARPPVD